MPNRHRSRVETSRWHSGWRFTVVVEEYSPVAGCYEDVAWYGGRKEYAHRSSARRAGRKAI